MRFLTFQKKKILHNKMHKCDFNKYHGKFSIQDNAWDK